MYDEHRDQIDKKTESLWCTKYHLTSCLTLYVRLERKIFFILMKLYGFFNGFVIIYVSFVLFCDTTVHDVVPCVYRPDLIDWARVCLQTPRENLQLAFDIAERVYNVTRLLDPEGDDDICYNTVWWWIFNMHSSRTDRQPFSYLWAHSYKKHVQVDYVKFWCKYMQVLTRTCADRPVFWWVLQQRPHRR